MAKKIITQEDLEKYPELAEKGIEVGQEADVPDDDEDDDTGGSNPPPNKERPDHP